MPDGTLSRVDTRSRLAVTPLMVCRVRRDGAIACLGSLGFRDPASSSKAPRVIEKIRPATDLALGFVHGCALTVDREVWCWGLNEKGQLGRGTATTAFEEPARVPGLAGIVQIAAHDNYTCARSADGTLTCALKNDDTVVCWGTGMSCKPERRRRSRSNLRPMKTIVLRGPGKNSLSTALMAATLDAVREAKNDAIFLTGDGDCFSAGLDMKEVASLDAAGMETFLGTLESLVKTLYEHPAPVVAWMNGHAIAGGCVMALCADVRVMTARTGARIGLNETPLGLEFPPVTFAMVRARLQGPTFDRIILEGGLYDASTAKSLGLVDAIGEEADARAVLDKMAAYPREAYAVTKAMVRPRLEISEGAQRRFRERTIPYWVSPKIRERLLQALKK